MNVLEQAVFEKLAGNAFTEGASRAGKWVAEKYPHLMSAAGGAGSGMLLGLPHGALPAAFGTAAGTAAGVAPSLVNMARKSGKPWLSRAAKYLEGA